MAGLLVETLVVWLGFWAVAAWGIARLTGAAARGAEGRRVLLVSTGLISLAMALLYLPLRWWLASV
ncbi:hypothetical protein J2T57_001130 [Natronocella acetinitrilica]|uniref:Uncharacterized protein n=1 Tax=Natronocella acetinitrilica TaxID=414046 RepID=A0AAE3KAZ3_9GAMM|nr:hypothetical protein [Natronocella acetinitrilica]